MLEENSIDDTVVVSIAVDNNEGLKKTDSKLSEKNDQSKIVLLSDPEHKIIDSYGLLNPESRGLPHPATYVIDKAGIVRWKFVEVDYSIRPDNGQVLNALKPLMQ